MQLADIAVSDSAPRMGRPPLGSKADDTKATIVRFEAEMRAKITAAKGNQSMSAFIREAVERELERRQNGLQKPGK